MGLLFPTIRRAFRPWRTTAPQQQSLLRLLAVAVEENLPFAPLIEAWAADEYGIQCQRLLRLAKLLRKGTPLPDAVEQVPGVVSEEDVLAIRFGTQSGTLVASLRERVDEWGDTRSIVSPRLRKGLIYIAALIVVGLVIVSFLQIKIVPEFEKIMQEFNMDAPEPLLWSIGFSKFFADYWYLFILAVLAFLWFVFSPWPGRRMRMRMFGPLYRPLRELHFADVLEKLSVTAEAGRPIAGAISTLARYHFDPALRRRLLFVRNEIEQGVDAWQSMQAVGLLSPQEVHALTTADRLGNRAWVLDQLAHVKERRTVARLSRAADLILPIVILLAGGFVLLQAMSVFSFLARIVHSLA
jgi:MSHA biogenesis protein MshG